MNVLLDTNIYLSDLAYIKPEFEALKNYIDTAGAVLLIPDVVDLEVRKNIKAKALSEHNKLQSLNLAKLNLIKDIPTAIDIEKEILKSYEAYIKATGNITLSNNVSLEEIINRSLLELPPFKAEGRGLRDALIWYTLIEYLKTKTDDKIAFISNNSSDFGKGDLKEELKKELKDLSLSDRVYFFNSLNDFLDEFGNNISFINGALVQAAIENHIDSKSLVGLQDELKDRLDFGMIGRESEITDYDYEEFEVESYYVYRATSSHYYVYTEVTLYFSVLVERYFEDLEYDAYSDNVRLKSRHESKYKNSHLYREYSLKINKSTQKVEGVEDFDGV